MMGHYYVITEISLRGCDALILSLATTNDIVLYARYTRALYYGTDRDEAEGTLALLGLEHCKRTYTILGEGLTITPREEF